MASDDTYGTDILRAIYETPERFIRKSKVLPGKTFYRRINRHNKQKRRKKVRMLCVVFYVRIITIEIRLYKNAMMIAIILFN